MAIDKATASKIGRKSRRKGKSFECEVARFYRAWFKGDDYQTVRNSGRTDIPGDVYRVTGPNEVHIECKHRKTFTSKDAIRGTKRFEDDLLEILEEWVRGRQPRLHIWFKDEHGYWIAQLGTGGRTLVFADRKEREVAIEVGCRFEDWDSETQRFPVINTVTFRLTRPIFYKRVLAGGHQVAARCGNDGANRPRPKHKPRA